MRVSAMRTLENALRRVGFVHVAGVDEVGRGCLAGPVVAGIEDQVLIKPAQVLPLSVECLDKVEEVRSIAMDDGRQGP